jgi:hypothetical protein
MTPVFALMFGRLLNAFFAASLEEEIRTFAFVILGVAGAAGLCGALLPCLVLPVLPLAAPAGSLQDLHGVSWFVAPPGSNMCAALLPLHLCRHVPVCLPHLGGLPPGQPRAPPLPHIPPLPGALSACHLAPISHCCMHPITDGMHRADQLLAHCC